MKRYIKVECPICGKISQGREPGRIDQGCQHFERIIQDEGVVIFVNDFGEEIPVDLSAVGDRCMSFQCPICSEPLDACVRGGAEEYKIEGKCPHFRELVSDTEGKMSAHFMDENDNPRVLPLY